MTKSRNSLKSLTEGCLAFYREELDRKKISSLKGIVEWVIKNKEPRFSVKDFNLSVDEFKSQFYYLMENDLLYKHIRDGNIMLISSESNTAHKPLGEQSEDNSNDVSQQISQI